MVRMSADIDDYIARAPDPARPILTKIRKVAAQIAPQATEVISYKMPAVRDGKIFLYFGAFKNHVGIYPPLTENAALIERLKPYRGAKGNLKFLFGQDLPNGLIAEVITALHQQYTSKK